MLSGTRADYYCHLRDPVSLIVDKQQYSPTAGDSLQGETVVLCWAGLVLCLSLDDCCQWMLNTWILNAAVVGSVVGSREVPLLTVDVKVNKMYNWEHGDGLMEAPFSVVWGTIKFWLLSPSPSSSSFSWSIQRMFLLTPRRLLSLLFSAFAHGWHPLALLLLVCLHATAPPHPSVWMTFGYFGLSTCYILFAAFL